MADSEIRAPGFYTLLLLKEWAEYTNAIDKVATKRDAE
jgi:hypothetical protein